MLSDPACITAKLGRGVKYQVIQVHVTPPQQACAAGCFALQMLARWKTSPLDIHPAEETGIPC
jgi:hypothetical protein